jgi:hypothetical protein
MACTSGHLDVVKFLVEERAVDVEAETLDFERTLKAAHAEGHLEVVQYLRERTDFEETDLNQNSYSLHKELLLCFALSIAFYYCYLNV